jgi:hypothetical protein
MSITIDLEEYIELPTFYLGSLIKSIPFVTQPITTTVHVQDEVPKYVL